MIKGHSKIELFDAKSGKRVYTQEKDNMVTNALSYLFGSNPLGVNANGNGDLFPLCPNALGGILLFPSSITENVDTIIAPSSNVPVGYASNDVNTTSDLKRGSMNLTESMAIDNGYKFVWDFATSQANGTIAALALTNKYGGQAYYGNTFAKSKFIINLGSELSPIGALSTDANPGRYIAQGVCYIDESNSLGYSVIQSGDHLSIKKIALNISKVHVTSSNNIILSNVVSSTDIYPSTFKGSVYTAFCCDSANDDGYIYGFMGVSNSSGSAVLNWIKIKISDYSFTEGTMTLNNIPLQAMGYIYGYYNYYYKWERNYTIVNGYLYVLSYDYKSVYKINVSNVADISQIILPVSSPNFCLASFGDVILGYNFYIANDVASAYKSPVFDSSTDLISGTNSMVKTKKGLQYMCTLMAGENMYTAILLQTNYLATINNITPVAKTADKTMKITYTVTES